MSMQIQSGKLYKNKTWLYLLPCLKYYGEELITNLNRVFLLAVGVADVNHVNNNKSIYLLIDTNLKKVNTADNKFYQNNFETFLNWIKYQDYYIDDYLYSGEKHMIVLKIPEHHFKSFDNFLKGRYSLMYTKHQIKQYFNVILSNKSKATLDRNSEKEKIQKVFSKDEEEFKNFMIEVNKEFKTNVTIHEVKQELGGEYELDYPPKKKEEVFNYEG